MWNASTVVVATTKVHIFKQITTDGRYVIMNIRLLLLPQRYIFSSKSQPVLLRLVIFYVVVATTKVHIFKQITTDLGYQPILTSCCCYHKGTYFQANHNFFGYCSFMSSLLLLPQRYIFSSKSQHDTLCPINPISCCCYHKGTYFQANHNRLTPLTSLLVVVVATTKVHIFKQITTTR